MRRTRNATTTTSLRLAVPPRWLATLLVAAAGCSARAAGNLDVPANDPLLSEASTDDQGAWQSAPWTRAVWIPYDSGATVTVHHGLGRQPTSVEAYISPDPDDTKTTKQRFAFSASGDIAVIDEVNDERVKIQNNTRGNYFLRIVLR